LGCNTTPTTYNIACTNYTCTIYEGGSDNHENGDPVANQRSETVGNTVGDAISTIANEIAGLDNIGFDDTINLDETADMPYKIDA
jgi:hypothetical protein